MIIKFKQGKYYPSNILLPSLNLSHKETYTFKFSKECLYIPSWENDTNKLAGFSLRLLPHKVTPQATYREGDYKGILWAHHYNSVRLVWRPELIRQFQSGEVPTQGDLTGRIELFLYTYEQGERKQVYLFSVDVDIEYEVEVIVLEQYITVVKDNHAVIFPHNFQVISTGYSLHPYMGGTDPAAHNLAYELTRS